MAAPNTPSTPTVQVVNSKFYESTKDGVKTTYQLFYDPKSGDYWASSTPLTDPKSRENAILVNGEFTKKAVEDSLFFKDKNPNTPEDVSISLSRQARDQVKGAFAAVGGTAGGNQVNPSVNSNQFKAQGANGPDIFQPIRDFASNLPGIDDVANLIKNFGTPNIADFDSANMRDLFKEPLYYPLDLKSTRQDILVITQYMYKSPYNELFKGELNNSSPGTIVNGAPRLSALRDPIQSVTLPIPNNVSDSNATGWGDDKMGTTAMAAAGNMPKALTAAAISQLAKAGGQFIPGLNLQGAALKYLTDLIGKNPGAIYNLLEPSSLVNPSLGAAIQSLVLQNIGFTDVTPETILSRGYGVITNSNVELLFTGPTLRGFQFGYIMSPRSQGEATMCRKILRFFKQGMAPKKNKASSTGYGGPSFFLATPNVFKLEYKSYDSSGKPIKIKGLNRFKICALTNLQTSYSDGQWAAYDEGQPARMQMNLAFKELEPVYESDYQETKSSTLPARYDDLGPVLPDEIGY
jgi:hypothetical protein